MLCASLGYPIVRVKCVLPPLSCLFNSIDCMPFVRFIYCNLFCYYHEEFVKYNPINFSLHELLHQALSFVNYNRNLNPAL